MARDGWLVNGNGADLFQRGVVMAFVAATEPWEFPTTRYAWYAYERGTQCTPWMMVEHGYAPTMRAAQLACRRALRRWQDA